MPALLLMIFMCITIADAKATYTEEIDNQRNVLREAFRRIQAFIRNAESPSDLIELNSATRVIIDNAEIPNIVVSRNSTTKQIEIHTTPVFGLVINYISDVVTYSISNPDFFSCQVQYQEYMYSELVKHGVRVNAGKPGIEFSPPESYYKYFGSSLCKQYASAFPLANELRVTRDQIMISILAFFYHHELGHIANSHHGLYATAIDPSASKSEQIRTFSKLMSRSREQEYEADNWAVRSMIQSGAELNAVVSPALPVYLMVAGGFDCFFEASETHPNGFQRFANIVSVATNAYESRYSVPLPHNVKAVFQDTVRLADKARKQLNCDMKIPGINN